MPGTIVWYPQFLSLLWAGLTAVALRLWGMNKYISLLLCYEILSYIFITKQSSRSMLCLFVGLAAIIISDEVAKLKNTKKIFLAISVMAIVQGAYVSFQSLNIDPFFHNAAGKADPVGFLGSVNQLGAYCAATGAILFSLNPWLIAFSILPIFLAKQNCAMIGLMSGLLCYSYFVYGKKTFFIMIFSALLLMIPFFIHSRKSSVEIMERVSLWKQSIIQLINGEAKQDFGRSKQTVKCNPLFGFGLGNFFTISPYTQMEFLPKNTGHVYEHAHNDLVEALYEFGYIGFVIVLLCVSSVVAVFVSSVKSIGVITAFSCLVAQSVASCGIYIFHAPVSLFMFCLTLGLFYAEVNHANKSSLSQVA